ncbi:MAG: CCA tRNA nucleotidyltransferase [Oligoflexales bacterium]
MCSKIEQKIPDKNYNDALSILAVLKKSGFEAMLAGGCVRDRLMGKTPNDYDIATNARHEEVTKACMGAGFKVVPTGVDHGTVTVVAKHSAVEVTTLRVDEKTFGRKAEVRFVADFEADAARRDFTINAMFEDATGRIYDFYGGQEHIRQQKLVFVGDPAQRIREDYLRILRLFRFWSRLSYEVEDSTLVVIKREFSNLRIVSQERITSELLGVFQGPNVVVVLEAMDKLGLLAFLLPEKSRGLESVGQFLKTNGALPRRELAYLSLLSGCDKSAAETLASRLKLSTEQKKILIVASFLHTLSYDSKSLPPIGETLQFISSLEKNTFPGSFLKLYAPLWAVAFPGKQKLVDFLLDTESKVGCRRGQPMPLSGNDLMQELSLQKGTLVGELLQYLHLRFLEGEWSTNEAGLDLARTWLSRRSGNNTGRK